jgi:hypothetical protein
MTAIASYSNDLPQGGLSSPKDPPLRRADMSPQQREKARSKDRIKYASRMARDPNAFRAKRRKIQKRYYHRHSLKKPGVHVNLVF